MSDEDWDTEELLEVIQPQGRTFGMRGRGFKCPDSMHAVPNSRHVGTQNWGRRDNHTDPRLGSREIVFCKGKNSYDENENDYHDKENGVYDDDDDDDNDDKDEKFNCVKQETRFRSNTHKSSQRSKFGTEETDARVKKTSVHYIPPEIEDVQELFSIGISSGINFDKYDEIEVKVTGEDSPEKIEDFERAGLHPVLLSNIRNSSYKKPTPIQKHALPIIMAGRDMMACAQTGSGKTCAFLIPIIHNLMQSEPHETRDGDRALPQVLTITPTRELAIQIYTEARKFAYGSKITACLLYGGTHVRHQIKKVEKGCNILIATAGRLTDILNRGKISLKSLRYIVLDEADRLLDASFMPQIENIFSSITNTGSVQVLMFSATFPPGVQRLASKFLRNYLFLTVGILGGACADVEQKFLLVRKKDKRLELIKLLKKFGSSKTLVFVNKKRTADIIAIYLSEMDFPATSMHGNRDQNLREEALNDFKSGKMDLLVATAVAARGLDINNVAHVINFDLPPSIDEYVHRIGRTGRIGNRGLATNFFDPSTDAALASDLIRVLAQAQQEVPEFLQEYVRGDYSTSRSGSSKFGGRDIRKKRSPREHEVPITFQPVTSFEDEEW